VDMDLQTQQHKRLASNQRLDQQSQVHHLFFTQSNLQVQKALATLLESQ